MEQFQELIEITLHNKKNKNLYCTCMCYMLLHWVCLYRSRLDEMTLSYLVIGEQSCPGGYS